MNVAPPPNPAPAAGAARSETRASAAGRLQLENDRRFMMQTRCRRRRDPGRPTNAANDEIKAVGFMIAAAQTNHERKSIVQRPAGGNCRR
jgi:hypothetical protein